MCVAMAGLWVRSLATRDTWAIEAGRARQRSRFTGKPSIVILVVETQRGRLTFARELSDFGLPLSSFLHDGDGAATQPASGVGFHALFNGDGQFVEVPLWFVLALTLALPVGRLYFRRRY